MKFAIMESIITEGGHEIDYDRILVEELTALGHKVEFYVPEGHQFKWNYGAPVHFLQGTGVSYKGVRGMRKVLLSAKREINRQRWYSQMARYAADKKFDALIFPSATYRYLRALQINSLKQCSLPVLFIIHGLTPQEAPLLFQEAEKVSDNPNIKIVVQTFAKQALTADRQLPNVHYIYPPNYIPRDIQTTSPTKPPEVLKLGFFGQYRKEKNLDGFLDQLIQCNFQYSFKLIVQGATTTPQDAEDFERIIKKYHQYSYLEFWHRPLIGQEWQEAIAQVDALVMPYGAERYRYHTSAILSTAIGFRKPVIIADNINPEVWQTYPIGLPFEVGNNQDLQRAMMEFINTFNDRFDEYQANLERAYNEYAPGRLAENLVKLASGR